MGLNSLRIIRYFFGSEMFPSVHSNLVNELIEREGETHLFAVIRVDNNYSTIVRIH